MVRRKTPSVPRDAGLLAAIRYHEAQIEKLSGSMPVQGRKWQSKMIAHHQRKITEIREELQPNPGGGK